MKKRDTIIISVLVNAALLVILFISATIKKDKVVYNPVINTALLEESTFDAKDLFSNETAKKEDKKLETDLDSFISLTQEEKAVPQPQEIKPKEEKIIHKLPSVALAQKEVKKIENFGKILVQKGDTLDRIAKNNKTSISELIRINHLPNSFLRIGQTLLVPGNISQSNIAKEVKPILNENISEFYTVKVGDNPYTIAIKHHIKPHELLKLNDLNEKKARRLRPGDKLRIR